MDDLDHEKIRISVVVSTFNRPERLGRCLRAILNQTYKPFEVIVVHDGPGATTGAAIAAQFSGKADIVFKETPEWAGRPAPARNLGISLATGAWIAFCDDDDLWLPHKLESQLRALRLNSESDAIFSRYLTMSSVESTEVVIGLSEARGASEFVAGGGAERLSLVDLLKLGGLCHSSALVRRAVIPRRFFPEGRFMRAFEDWCAWLKLSVSGSNLLLVDQPLLRYLCDNSTSIRRNRVLHNIRLIAYTFSVLALRAQFSAIGVFFYSRVRALLRRMIGGHK
jgi:glycosyltransferase involved in cell wall biosynthesis